MYIYISKILPLLVLPIGLVLGLFLLALLFLLKGRRKASASFLIIGMLVGSLWVLWPFQARDYGLIRGKQQLLHSTPMWPAELGSGEALAVALGVIGIVAVVTIDMLAKRKPAPGHGLP